MSGAASVGEPLTPAPDRDCALCPRLANYRQTNRALNPDWFNAPVPSFGPLDAPLLVVGMAPGLRGANRTGRPFTGDHAGVLLYQTLIRFGLARGEYRADPGDGLVLVRCRISNAVRCAPPANAPLPTEVKACNRFLAAEIRAMSDLKAILALGVLAHAAVLRTFALPVARVRFRHGTIHDLPGGVYLADSYHVSRYNTNTGRLTETMFQVTIGALLDRLGQAERSAAQGEQFLPTKRGRASRPSRARE